MRERVHFSSPQHLLHSSFSTSSAAINQCYLLLSTPWAASQGERQALLTIMPCVYQMLKQNYRSTGNQSCFCSFGGEGSYPSPASCITHQDALSHRLQLPAPALIACSSRRRQCVSGAMFLFLLWEGKFKVYGADDDFLPAGNSRTGVLDEPFLYVC